MSCRLSTSFALLVGLTATSCFSTHPVWTYESDRAGATLGTLCIFAGDENGDGYDDILALAGGEEPTPGVPGQVYLFRGGPTGPGSTPTAVLNTGYAFYGWPLEAVGDVNGDGLDDVILGGYASAQPNMRMIELRPGPLTGSALFPHIYLGPLGDMGFGRTLAGLGDLNQDGYSDFAMGHRGGSGAGAYGQVDVYYGAADFFLQLGSGLASWGVTGAADFGASISTSDVDGDGWEDLLIGSPLVQQQTGRIDVYLNGPSGLATTPAWSVVGAPSESLGIWIQGIGDRNADGFGDFLAYGNAPSTPGQDELTVFFGSPSGATRGASHPVHDPVYAVTAVALTGDVDGDGLTDIAFSEGGGAGSGSVHVFNGIPGAQLWSTTTPTPGVNFGASIDAGGDVDGDGKGDLLIGAPGYSNGEIGEGAIHLHRGEL